MPRLDRVKMASKNQLSFIIYANKFSLLNTIKGSLVVFKLKIDILNFKCLA